MFQVHKGYNSTHSLHFKIRTGRQWENVEELVVLGYGIAGLESEISESMRLEQLYKDYHQFTNNLLLVWHMRITKGQRIVDGSKFFGVDESRDMMGDKVAPPNLAVRHTESVTSIGDSSLGSRYMESERDDGEMEGTQPDSSKDDNSFTMSN